MAERQQDHFGSPMAASARGAARGERERGEGGSEKQGGGRDRRRRSGETCHNDKSGLLRGSNRWE